MHRGVWVFQNPGPFRKAEKGIVGRAYRLVPVVGVKARPKGGLMDQVSAIFRPFIEKIDCVRKAGNLLHDNRGTPHEDGAAENFGVHFISSDLVNGLSV